MGENIEFQVCLHFQVLMRQYVFSAKQTGVFGRVYIATELHPEDVPKILRNTIPARDHSPQVYTYTTRVSSFKKDLGPLKDKGWTRQLRNILQFKSMSHGEGDSTKYR